MAEAEDVLVDAARHGTVFIRDLWRRHRSPEADPGPALADLAPRLDLLLSAVHGTSFPLRVALPPARPTLLDRLLRSHAFPRHRAALPATDGSSIWLPGELDLDDPERAASLWRAMALLQARRAQRGAARASATLRDPLLRDLLLLFEARAAEADVARELPGTIGALLELRRLTLDARPPPSAFPHPRRALEVLLRRLLATAPHAPPQACASPADSVAAARAALASCHPGAAERRRLGPMPLLRDWWTGELRVPDGETPREAAYEPEGADPAPVRSARMARRPERRSPEPDEDRAGTASVWAVQQDQPHEAAEDPFGLERPVDRDDQTRAEEFGNMLSELPAARTVSSPQRALEVLLSDDPPASALRMSHERDPHADARVQYPEWDWQRQAYRDPGVTVHLQPPSPGPRAWVDRVLERHRGLLEGIRRRFEMLRARPVRLRRQMDGEDVDLEALVESRADLRAGSAHGDRLYEARRPGRRSIAIALLADASGSTDAWIGGKRRIIDVEREALLLVCIALEGLGEPFAVRAFSGEGPHGVAVRPLKGFDEAYGEQVALRVAGLEPDRYTRTGAALRHATAELMHRPARHRLLLLLSDGKPNDADRYDGRYGVEDTRRAVAEARLQGVFPFCLTVDRQAPGYLPQVFGAGGYALLQSPQRLPLVLLDWMRRLIA